MIKNNQLLTLYNSLAIASTSKRFIILTCMEDLSVFFENSRCLQNQKFYILGGGTNTLFIDPEIGTIIKPEFKGYVVTQDDEYYYLDVAAGENWHQLVLDCVAKNINGLENLALIPGNVGAAPVQNIGAYGVEFSSFCESVEWFDFATGKLKRLTNDQCRFNYRDSIFKQELKGKGLITAVRLKLSKNWQPTLIYQGLSSLEKPISAKEIMLKVIDIRNQKLPDPDIIPNAGSFFKNPVISEQQFKSLLQRYPNIPYYEQQSGDVKIAAGWLIEHVNLKGYHQNKVGVHDQQALVLVNLNKGSGQDIVALAKLVQATVFNKFSILLEPEVRFVGADGEVNALEYLNNE